MSTVPVGDVDLLAMTSQQFFSLTQEDKPGLCRMPAGADAGWGRSRTGRPDSFFGRPQQDPISSVNPFGTVDRGNEWLKDNTYVDMFGWRDAIMDGRTAVKQVMLLGIMGDAYLTKNKAGVEIVIFKGYSGLREKLPGTRYLRENPIVHAADFVIGHKEMLEEAGKATKVAILCFVAWDIVHECLQNKPDMTRLGITIVSDILQSVAATYIGVGIGVVFGAVFGGIVITFIVAAAATFGVGMLITGVEQKADLTKKAVSIAKKIENSGTVTIFVEFAKQQNKNYTIAHSSPMAYMFY